MKTARHILVGLAALLVVALVGGAVVVVYGIRQTEAMIGGYVDQVLAVATQSEAARIPDGDDLSSLPPPVRRWIAFTFPEGVAGPRHTVRYRMQGDFRRPGSDEWESMTATQYIAAGAPAFVFAGTTWMAPGLWARAMDAYADGEMDMKARVLSAIAVVDETGDPDLNRISLQRYLLESPMAPSALLPSDRVRWESIDRRHARVVISADGLTAAYRVTFAENGAILQFDAEAGGSLDQPYHGAGEQAIRGDYREVGGVMLPMSFIIARVIDGDVQPFWRGRVVELDLDVLEPF